MVSIQDRIKAAFEKCEKRLAWQPVTDREFSLAKALWEATQDTPAYTVGGEQVPQALLEFVETIEHVCGVGAA